MGNVGVSIGVIEHVISKFVHSMLTAIVRGRNTFDFRALHDAGRPMLIEGDDLAQSVEVPCLEINIQSAGIRQRFNGLIW
jgi:hypothetical protein